MRVVYTRMTGLHEKINTLNPETPYQSGLLRISIMSLEYRAQHRMWLRVLEASLI